MLILHFLAENVIFILRGVGSLKLKGLFPGQHESVASTLAFLQSFHFA